MCETGAFRGVDKDNFLGGANPNLPTKISFNCGVKEF